MSDRDVLKHIDDKTRKFLERQSEAFGGELAYIAAQCLDDYVLGMGRSGRVLASNAPVKTMLQDAKAPGREEVLKVLRKYGAEVEAEPSDSTPYYRLKLNWGHSGSIYLHETASGCRLDATGKLATFLATLTAPSYEGGRYPAWRGDELYRLLVRIKTRAS